MHFVRQGKRIMHCFDRKNNEMCMFSLTGEGIKNVYLGKILYRFISYLRATRSILSVLHTRTQGLV